jgi:DNA-binding IclR family transcriptional regulator
MLRDEQRIPMDPLAVAREKEDEYTALIAEVERLVGRSFPPRTPHTLTRLDALLRDLEEVRHTGFALDREEHTLGISAAGVALADALGNPIAISVPVPTQRFTGREGAIVETLLATRRALAERFAAEIE